MDSADEDENRQGNDVAKCYKSYVKRVDDYTSSTVSKRPDGLKGLRDFLTPKRNLALLEEHRDFKWIDLLQIVFSVAAEDRNAVYNPKKPRAKSNTGQSIVKASLPAINRLQESTDFVRFVVERVSPRIDKIRALRAVVNHLTDMCTAGSMSGSEPPAFTSTYTRALRNLLSYSPHLEHLDRRMWTNIVALCFGLALGDRVRMTSEEDNFGDELAGDLVALRMTPEDTAEEPVVTRDMANSEDIELMACLEMAFRCTAAPFQSYSNIIFHKFVRFFEQFEGETSAHIPAVTALNRMLAELELNDLKAMTHFGPLLWPILLSLWTTKNGVLKEQLVMALKFLLPFVTPATANAADVESRTRKLYELILFDENRWRVAALNLDTLRLGNVRDGKLERKAFCLATFQHGDKFESTDALSWAVLELGAACLSKLYAYSEVFKPAERGQLATPDAQAKRRKIEDPLASFIDSLMDPLPIDSTIHRLQILLFLVEHHWSSLHLGIGQRIMRTLLHVLTTEDAQIQCWVLLVVAAIAHRDRASELSSETLAEWEHLWTIALRKIQVPALCRAASHLAAVLLGSGRVNSTLTASAIEGLARDLDMQGPNFPSDAVCAFLSACLVIASDDVHLYSLRLPEKVLAWLTSAWKPFEGLSRPHTITQARPRADPLHVADLCALIFQVCALEHVPTLAATFVVPDGPIASMAIATAETSVLRDFTAENRIPPYVAPDTPAPPFAGTSQGVSTITQRRVSIWFEKMLDDLSGDKESWRGADLAKARRCLDLATTALVVEGAFQLNGVTASLQTVRQACVLLEALLPHLILKKWSPAERASLFEGVAPLFVALPPQPPVTYPCLLDPGPASDIAEHHIPHRNTVSRCIDFEAVDYKLLATIWRLEPAQKLVLDLARLLEGILNGVAPNSRSTTQDRMSAESQTQGSHAPKDLADDDFDSIENAESVLQAMASGGRAGAACMAILVRGIVSGVMVSTHARGPVRVQAIVEALRTSNGTTAIGVAEQAYNAVLYGIMSFRKSEAEDVVESLGRHLMVYGFAFDERHALGGLHFLECTANIWIRSRDIDSAEAIGRNARQLCSWYAKKIMLGLLPSWRVRLRYVAFSDFYLTIDTDQSCWDTPGEEDVIRPTAMLPTRLDDEDFRVRFRAASSAAALFNFLHVNGLPASDLFLDIQEKIVTDLKQFERVISQLVCMANIIIVSAQRRRSPYEFLLQISAVEKGYGPLIEALLRGAAARLGLPDQSALYRTYVRFLTELQADVRYPALVCGYTSHRNLLESNFRETGGVLLVADKVSTFEAHCAILSLPVQRGAFDCFPHVIALAVLEHWRKQMVDRTLSVDALLRTIARHAAKVLGAMADAVTTAQLVESVVDDIIAVMLSLLTEPSWPAGASLPALAADKKAAAIFSAMLGLEADLVLVQPAKPCYDARTMSAACTWVSKTYKVFNNTAVVYSIVQQLFTSIDRAPFLSDQKRHLIGIAYAVALGRNVYRDAAFLESLAEPLVVLLKSVDLAPLVASMLRWCFSEWLALTDGKDSLATELREHLLHAGQAARSLSASTDPHLVQVGQSLWDTVDGAIRVLFDRAPGEERVVELLWPVPILNVADVDVQGSLRSRVLAADKFHLVGLINDDVRTPVARSTLWRLLDSMSAAEAPKLEECVALADLLYRVGGQVRRPSLDEPNAAAAQPIDLGTISTNDEQGIKSVVAAKLLEFLATCDLKLAHLTSAALRILFALTAAVPLSTEILSGRSARRAIFLASERLLRHSRFREREPRTLAELGNADWVKAGGQFATWIRDFARLLADSRAEQNRFYAQLDALLGESSDVAARLLPNLVHSILLQGVNADDDTARTQLSAYFTRLLQCATTDAQCTRTIVNLVVFLRRQTQVESSTPLTSDLWLSMPWVLLAEAAVRSQAHLTALLFLELAHEYDGLAPRQARGRNAPLELRAQQVHYAIYASIDDPDGFYGSQSSDIRQALTRRYHHEKRWNDAFRIHGADYEGVPDPRATLGVMESLASSGFSRLAMSILKPSRLEGGISEADLPPGLPYQLAWQTDTWDLPIERRAAGTSSAALYSALRLVHASREHDGLLESVNAGIVSEASKLATVSLDLPMPSRDALSTLLALREIRNWAGLNIGDSLDLRVARDLATLSPPFSFPHAEHILTTRISLLRSIRVRERGDQIGEMTSVLGEEATSAERACLLQLSRVARHSGRLQTALNALTLAQGLVEVDRRDPLVDKEFANVLWAQGEHGTAMRLLSSSYSEGASRTALVSARLGEWSAQSRVKTAREILSDYFEPAIAALADNTAPVERTKVHNAFARFADAQYQESRLGADEKRRQVELYTEHRTAEARAFHKQLADGSMESGRTAQFQRMQSDKLMVLAEEQRALEEMEATTAILLASALRNYSQGLVASDTQDNTILRFCALWLANSSNGDLNRDIVARCAVDIPSHKFIFVAHQLSARLDKPAVATPFSKVVSKLVTTLCHDHPFHALYHVNALRNAASSGKSQPRSQSRSSRRSSTFTEEQSGVRSARALAADDVFAKVKEDAALRPRVEALELLCEAYIEWARWDIRGEPAYFTIKKHAQKSGTFRKGTLKLASNSMLRTVVKDLPIPPPTMDLAIDKTCQYRDVHCIHKYSADFTIPGGVNLPSIVTCRTMDGAGHVQLIKGNDDSRQDAVMEQTFVLINELLDRDVETRRRELRIRTYKVVPLAPDAGILQFVVDTASLSEVLIPAYAKFLPPGAYQPAAARTEIGAAEKAHPVNSPSWKAAKLLTYNNILAKLPPVMRHVFRAQAVPSLWFDQSLNYSRSVATTSIVGYILGIGDRHVSNILMDKKRGDLVIIDLGIAFDQGRRLPIPETVPFRLTRNIVDGLGMHGVDGVFRRCAEETLRVLRDGSDVVMTVLEVFKHDPLQSWALSVEMAQRIQGSSAKSSQAIEGGERSHDADIALNGVADKLSKLKSVEHTVNELIVMATDSTRLAYIYSGWQSYL